MRVNPVFVAMVSVPSSRQSCASVVCPQGQLQDPVDDNLSIPDNILIAYMAVIYLINTYKSEQNRRHVTDIIKLRTFYTNSFLTFSIGQTWFKRWFGTEKARTIYLDNSRRSKPSLLLTGINSY